MTRETAKEAVAMSACYAVVAAIALLVLYPNTCRAFLIGLLP